MRQQLLKTMVVCSACLALGAQAQTTPGSAGGATTDPSSSSSGAPSTYPSTPPSSSSGLQNQSGLSDQRISPTGRMGHEAVRGSQLTGAQVSGSSGNQIGTISDTIINPSSGRLEFAVISLSGSPSAATSTATPGTPGAASSSTGISSTPGAGGKQVAVPWMLLRSSSSAGSSAAGTAMGSPNFVFMGDASKLESAPNFDANTDLNQPSWRQSVFSYFGLSGRGSATGGAETPGGTSSSTHQSPTGSQ